MTDQISRTTSAPPYQQEVYAHGYDSALAQKLHASRTVQHQAAWFLPYLQSGMSLLDCGCATGSITVGLAAVVAPGEVIGVDVSTAEIERARARIANAGVANLRFEVGNIYQLEFPDNHFDAIFCHNVQYPDNVAVATASILVIAGGAIKNAKTTSLLTIEDGLAAMQKAGEVAGVYKPAV